MKQRRVLLAIVSVVALFVGMGGLWIWQAKQQHTLDRQLIAALVHNDSKQALALVNRGADPNTPCPETLEFTLKHFSDRYFHRSTALTPPVPTAFELACGVRWPISDADSREMICYPEDVPLLQAMLAHGLDVGTINHSHQLVFHCAVHYSRLHVAQFLLQHGAQINEAFNDGETPLMESTVCGSPAMTRLLLEHGANVSHTDLSGQTALHYAVIYERDGEFVRVLMQHGANPNVSDRSGHTPIQLAHKELRSDFVALMRRKR